jgi:hypothetical protein
MALFLAILEWRVAKLFTYFTQAAPFYQTILLRNHYIFSTFRGQVTVVLEMPTLAVARGKESLGCQGMFS